MKQTKYQEALFKIRKSRVIEKSVGGVFSNYEILSIEEVLEEESNLLKELVDKATPKKPYYPELYPSASCPVCKSNLGDNNFCRECGQAIDWSK